ncbi:MAG: C-terminal binding protein [Planctomycetes bacterium]|nr:C-terminal binding protein [Planctomycetota bacterium]
MSRHQVLVTDLVTGNLEPEERVLGDLADVRAVAAVNEDDLVGQVEEADALMVYHTMIISRRTIERLRRCKLIVRCGVGYDNVDGACARGRGIPLANVPDYGTEEVADSAIGMALALTRGITFLNGRLRDERGPWSWRQVVPLHRLRGRSFGIVGLGRIGTAFAIRAKALGVNVVFFDPYKPDGFDRALRIERVESLDELLARSFVVSLHCPLTRETERLIDAAALARMQPGSYLVNTARGAVVDTTALAPAIASGRLAGAAIDVLPHEPPLDDDPLIAAWRDPGHAAHDRVILNPHTAFYSEEGLIDMRVKGAEACGRALQGLPLRNIVN